MKKITLLLVSFFITAFSFSQNITFEDETLKLLLVTDYIADINGDGVIDEKIDTDDDGEISLDEALQVKKIEFDLGLSGNIIKFNEATYFENLESLFLIQTELDEIDLTGCTQLTSLDLRSNNLTSIDISNQNNLEYLNLRHNDYLVNLDLTNNSQLKTIVISNGQYTAYDFSNLPLLEDFEVINGYSATSLDFSQNPNLKRLSLGIHNIGNLNISNNVNLEDLDLNLQQSPNTFNELDLTNNINLERLRFHWTGMTSIDLSNKNNLKILEIDATALENIYIPEEVPLTSLMINSNSNLETLIIERDEEFTLEFVDNFNIEYVCIPDNLISLYEADILQNSSSVVVNSFCSYTPFDADYAVKGNVSFSETNDCENSTNISNFSFDISTEGAEGVIFANSEDGYHIPLIAGTYTLKPNVDNSDFFTITPESVQVTFPNEDNLDEIIQDFCVTPNGEVSDVEITLIPIDLARPGFDVDYKIVYKNIGNQTISGDVDFNFDDTIIDFVEATPLGYTISTGNISWPYEDLAPFEEREIFFRLNLNSPQEDPALVGGEILNLDAVITFGEEFRVSSLKQEVVNSYDPNDKTCLEGNVLTPDLVGGYLTYRIRFENTGTASAVNIVVEDQIDPLSFDISSIKMIDSSHDCVMRTEGNLVKFFFDDIMLPHEDETNDGYVIFKIKTLDTLEIEDTIENTAEIYFDFNDAIITNTAVTTVQKLDVDAIGMDSSIAVFPNPTTEILNISSKNSIEKVEVYSILGKLIVEFNFDSNNKTEQLNIKTLETGVYMLKVSTSVGEKQLKLVIE
ncbi:T9SS type A sorting domain-containing protein [Aureivirga sp. CE67]|uniref:T9SS type A sorting domain-containing protein n=1 Tax=Aureivirga sp. CE67 TaxID=1788983 RepID=UPI0018CAB472|nr:T9SS type A sorting domain-containing protein [Aureivirga sp. CE67]